MTIVHISDDIKHEFKIDLNGKATVSIRGAERITGVSDTALINNLKFKGSNFSTSKMAKMLIEAGFEGANFSTFSKQGIPDTALAIILEYYAFEAEENCTQEAQFAYRSFAAMGIRTWIQGELGYQKQEPKQIQQIEDLTENQIKAIVLFAALDENPKDKLDPAQFLKGIDPLFWNIPTKACVNLLKRHELKGLQFLQNIIFAQHELDFKHDQVKMMSQKAIYISLIDDCYKTIEHPDYRLPLRNFIAALPAGATRGDLLAISALESKPVGFGKPKKPKNK